MVSYKHEHSDNESAISFTFGQERSHHHHNQRLRHLRGESNHHRKLRSPPPAINRCIFNSERRRRVLLNKRVKRYLLLDNYTTIESESIESDSKERRQGQLGYSKDRNSEPSHVLVSAREYYISLYSRLNM